MTYFEKTVQARLFLMEAMFSLPRFQENVLSLFLLKQWTSCLYYSKKEKKLFWILVLSFFFLSNKDIFIKTLFIVYLFILMSTFLVLRARVKYKTLDAVRSIGDIADKQLILIQVKTSLFFFYSCVPSVHSKWVSMSI